MACVAFVAIAEVILMYVMFICMSLWWMYCTIAAFWNPEDEFV